MQNSEQLSALSGKKSLGWRTMDVEHAEHAEERDGKEDMSPTTYQADESNGSLPQSAAPEGRRKPRRRTLTHAGSYPHPLPTIETLMTYPSLTRPTYNSLVKGEPPARVYSTVIHTPKPAALRPRLEHATSTVGPRLALTASALDLISKRANEANHEDGKIRLVADSEEHKSVHMEVDSPPPSPAGSTTSTSRATISSSAESSPPSTPGSYVDAAPPVAGPSTDQITPGLEDAALSLSSPAPSFRTSRSTLSDIYDVYSSASSSAASSSHASSSVDSLPDTIMSGPRSTSSPVHASPQHHADVETPDNIEIWMAYPYPSPPPSPMITETTPEPQHPPPPLPPHKSLQPSTHTTPPTNTFPRTPLHTASLPLIDQLPDTLFDDGDDDRGDGDALDWDLQGGDVVLGAAGVAVSPRMMMGRKGCKGCGHRRMGLGLWVIDEE